MKANILIAAGYATIGQGAGPMIVTERGGLFAKHGLQVDIRMMGGAVGVVRGLVARQIKFGNFAAPALLRANLLGEADLDFLTGGIAAQRDYVLDNEEITRNFVKAYVEGMHRYRTDRSFTVQVQQEYSGFADRTIAEQTYEITQPGMPRILRPVLSALRTAPEVMSKQCRVRQRRIRGNLSRSGLSTSSKPAVLFFHLARSRSEVF